MKNKNLFVSLGFVLLLLIGPAGCSQENDKPGAQPSAGKPAVAVDVVTVKTADLAEGIEVIGSLAPKFQSEIKSEYTGIVTEVYVSEWVRVKKGDPLAQLDTREAKILLQKAEAGRGVARASLLQAEVEMARNEREYQRFLKMKEAGLVTQQSLDEAKSGRDASMAAITAVKAQIAATEEEIVHAKTRLDKAVLRAPMDGVVASRNVNVGDLAGEMGSPKILFLIVDNRILNLTVTVPSSRVSALKIGQTLSFQTDAVPGRQFQGKVMYLNPSLSEADRSLRVVAEVINSPEILKGGMFVKGLIETGQRKGVLRIPRSALSNWNNLEGKADVFIIEGHKAHLRRIAVGNQSGDDVEVAGGLSVTDQVVVRGGFNLRDGDAVTVQSITGE
jgi:membrane fusion protein, multidrug efflux system